jgi:hypothetical protein
MKIHKITPAAISDAPSPKGENQESSGMHRLRAGRSAVDPN